MTFEVITKPRRKPRWQIRDEEGNVVPLRPGKVFLPRGTTAENRLVRDAVDLVLAKMATEQ